MKQTYAVAAVAEVELTRAEVERIVQENLLVRGADPSYNFNTARPLFIWREDGGLIVRFIEDEAYARERDRHTHWKGMPTADEMRQVIRDRERKVLEQQGRAPT